MRLAWSNLSKIELRELRRYSVERWGSNVGLRYIQDVLDAAKRIAARPSLAKPLKGQLRIMRMRSHYLIVHVDEAADRLTIARILHSAMDLDRHIS